MKIDLNVPWETRLVDDDPEDEHFLAVFDSQDWLIGIFPIHIAKHIVKCVNQNHTMTEALTNLKDAAEGEQTLSGFYVSNVTKNALPSDTGETNV